MDFGAPVESKVAMAEAIAAWRPGPGRAAAENREGARVTVQKAESSARRRGITAGVRDRSKRGRMVATLRVMTASG